jgi:hypothetical protein
VSVCWGGGGAGVQGREVRAGRSGAGRPGQGVRRAAAAGRVGPGARVVVDARAAERGRGRVDVVLLFDGLERGAGGGCGGVGESRDQGNASADKDESRESRAPPPPLPMAAACARGGAHRSGHGGDRPPAGGGGHLGAQGRRCVSRGSDSRAANRGSAGAARTLYARGAAALRAQMRWQARGVTARAALLSIAACMAGLA